MYQVGTESYPPSNKTKKKKKERKKSQEIKKSKACVKLFKNEEDIWLLGYSSLQR